MLYPKWVLTPVNLPEAKSNIEEYTQAGFPGCVGSSNCTHIVSKRCQYNFKNNHLSAKSSLTTWTFNLTCNHIRCILHTTNGGPGQWNNQSMVRLDMFVSGVRDGTVLDEVRNSLVVPNGARTSNSKVANVFLKRKKWGCWAGQSSWETFCLRG